MGYVVGSVERYLCVVKNFFWGTQWGWLPAADCWILLPWSKKKKERCCWCIHQARASKNAKFWSQARMFLTSGYVLIVCVLVKSDCVHTFRCGLSKKRAMFLSPGCHVLKSFSPIQAGRSSATRSSKRELAVKSESCGIEESGCLIQLRNRERMQLATSRIDASRRNQTTDSSISHVASPGWFFFCPG